MAYTVKMRRKIFSLHLALFISCLPNVVLAVTYTVDNLATDTDDGNYAAGQFTLREAINLANTSVGVADIINFNYGAAGPYTVNLVTALPALTDVAGVTINGFSNPGASANLISVFSVTSGSPMNGVYKVILSNSTGIIPTGLVLSGDYNVIRGLVLQNFGDGTPSANDIAITITGNHNQVIGCYIGIDAGGTTRGALTGIGISISGSNNIIGDGTAAGANLISGMNGSLYGILLSGVGATGNSIMGNIIGLQKDGTTLVVGLGQNCGIYISAATSNAIGGIGTGNIISGNDTYGVYITGICTSSTVKGNYVGTQANGTSIVASATQGYGIYLNAATSLTIGYVSLAGEKNIISGNANAGGTSAGIYATGACTSTTIKGNYIGLDKNGTTFITSSEQVYGIRLNTCTSITIGGSAANELNVIAGNWDSGINITGTSTGSSIIGNYIGTDLTGASIIAGMAAVDNQANGGIFISAATNLTIGGNTNGERNIISANGTFGIRFSGICTGTLIKGNYIGTDVTGILQIAGSSQNYGVYSSSSSGSSITIGTAGAGNLISGNNTYGIYMVSVSSIAIMGNYIGTDKNGTAMLTSSTQSYGIYSKTSTSVSIGSSAAGDGNLCSGNATYGIYINGSSTGTVIKGNYVGTDATGTAFLTGSNQDYGIYSASGTPFVIGGNSLVGEGNIISGNTTHGIYLTGSFGSNTIKGNKIGVDKNGTLALPNTTDGINIIGASSSNIIGGNAVGEANIIANNGDDGIDINSASSDFNLITRNSFFCNSGKAINLNYSGTPGNNAEPAPIIVTSLTTGATGTAANNATVELYYNHDCAGCQGKTYVTTVTADGSGNWSYAGALTSGAQLLATSTSTTNNTSEFSSCSAPLPIELLNFTARKINDRQILIQWATATETNNDFFTLEKNKDGMTWQSFGTVKGAGNSSQLLNYTFIDEHPFNGINFYQLKQTDYDGKYTYSQIIPIDFENTGIINFLVYPNPIHTAEGNNFSLTLAGLQTESSILVVMYDVLGKEYYSKIVLTDSKGSVKVAIESSTPLTRGVYMIRAAGDNKLFSKKIVIE